MFYTFFEPTYIFVIIGMFLSIAASGYVSSTFRKYDSVYSKKNISGTDAARYILKMTDIKDVGVTEISGDLTDNYDSRRKMLSLSQATANSTSVAAIAVAAHECGHAVQDKVHYVPLRMRAAMVPVVNFGSSASFPILLLGLLFSSPVLVNAGIILFSLVLLFQIVTLPVEFNASRRALNILSDGGLLTGEEVPIARKVLFAAALTYVASALATALQLVRLLLLFGNRGDRD